MIKGLCIHRMPYFGGNVSKDIHKQLGLRKVINACGSYTPFGVSRSSDGVADAVAQSLKDYFVMSELADAAGKRIAEIYGVENVAFSHCAAGAITMAIAAIMVGNDMDLLYALPATKDLKNKVVIQSGHLVNYGQPIEQAVRLSGAGIIVAGTEQGCSVEALDKALVGEDVCALLCVESRLCKSGTVPAAQAVKRAHERGVPVVIDGAAQDLRLDEVIGFGADLTITSAQKYLSAPTCGLALGKRHLTECMQLQEKGIGRAMKPTKEGIIGALAGVEERAQMDMGFWETVQKEKSEAFAKRLNQIIHLSAECQPDQTGLPFSRVRATLDEKAANRTAVQVTALLADHNPMIALQDHELKLGVLNFEIVGLNQQELKTIYDQLSVLLD